MIRSILAAATAAALAATAPVAHAQDDSDALVTFKVMTLETATKLAQGALQACHDAGFQVAVVVVDRFGNTQVALRDRFAGPHTIDTATRKAWTAVSFRIDTLALSELTRPDSQMAAIHHVTGALALGGGVPVEAAGSIVGGVGVSGAPSPAADHECSEAGIEAVADDLLF